MQAQDKALIMFTLFLSAYAAWPIAVSYYIKLRANKKDH